mgnify:FL=1
MCYSKTVQNTLYIFLSVVEALGKTSNKQSIFKNYIFLSRHKIPHVNNSVILCADAYDNVSDNKGYDPHAQISMRSVDAQDHLNEM